LNNPELTAERFIENPFREGDRLYATGDVARWLPDGSVEFIGRVDHQVKIRGFRIELEEIEAQLSGLPGIDKAVVIDRAYAGGEKYLCAYIVPSADLETAELKKRLAADLPGHMIPSYFIPIDHIPLNPSGKVDRKALPEPSTVVEEAGYTAPRNEMEMKMADIWSEVLGIEKVKIGIDTDFFSLGGHSLKATALTSRIHKTFDVNVPMTVVFQTSTIRGLSQFVEENMAEQKHISIPVAPEKEFYPVSAIQKRFYIVVSMEGVSTAFNIPQALMVEGKLNVRKLESAFQSLIQRHESLRTSFELKEGEPVQVIHKSVDFSIEHMDAEGKDVKEMLMEFIAPFDLSKAPLLRVKLVRFSREKHLLFVETHHIVSDGTSQTILMRDIIDFYEDRIPPPLRVQYKDVVEWQYSPTGRSSIARQEEYWLSQFKGELPILDIHTDFPRPPVQSFYGDQIDFSLDEELSEKLKHLVRRTGSTLFMALLAALNVLLHKYTGQEDIVIGTAVAGREDTDMENILGVFINALAMRNQPESGKTFDVFLEEVKKNTLNAYENQGYPFDVLIESVLAKKDIGRNPLYDVDFVFLNMEPPPLKTAELTFIPVSIELKTAQMDIAFYGVEAENKINFSVLFCTDLFKKKTIERLIGYFKKVVTAVVENEDTALRDIDILSEQERNRLLVEFNGRRMDYPKDKTFHQLFEDQVEKTPDHIAVAAHSETHMTYMTYKELNEKTDRLAGMLWAGAGNITAVMTERRPEMIVGVMAVMKAGGAYLPIDPEYPEDRINYILADSSARVLLTTRSLAAEAGTLGNREDGKKEIIYIDDYKETAAPVSLPKNPASSLAYVIYTSGSTGKPKGVMVQHNHLVNVALAWRQEYRLQEMEVNLLQMASFSFDVFAGDLARVLLNGGKMVITPQLAVDPPSLYRLITNHRVTLFESTPSYIFPVMEYVHNNNLAIDCLKLLILGSDVCPFKDFKVLTERFGERMRIVNSYGVTEAAIDSSYYEPPYGEELPSSGNVPIGKPMPNMSFRILDPAGKLLPPGVPGELHIGGAGVTHDGGKI
jgi:amino acid adenylation domain-containing protein